MGGGSRNGVGRARARAGLRLVFLGCVLLLLLSAGACGSFRRGVVVAVAADRQHANSRKPPTHTPSTQSNKDAVTYHYATRVRVGFELMAACERLCLQLCELEVGF